MILRIQPGAPQQVLDLREAIERAGLRTTASLGRDGWAIVRCIGDVRLVGPVVDARPGVEVLETSSPHPLVSRCAHQRRTIIHVPGVRPVAVGGAELAVFAGPCSVESREQILDTALGVARCGAAALLGGAFKPRTSPYGFQGLGEEGLEYLAEARRISGLPIVTEVMDPRLVDRVAERADVLQIGARNMQNYPLLDEVGRVQRPVLLKRGISATIEELLLAAERIVARGNDGVILCERGIRTYETATRNTLDVSAIPLLKDRSHLPVLIDPSHAAGRRDLVPTLALAGVAAGADGLLVEVHAHPSQALTDGAQALSLPEFSAMMERLRPVGRAVGRSLAAPTRVLGGVA
jgi:3-deoxy-7-phosphoheptulonate synthase